MRRGSIAAILLAGGFVLSSALGAGSPEDPLISLDWLRNMFMPQTVAQMEARVEERFQAQGGVLASAVSGQEERMNKGDVLTVETGGSVVVLSGKLTGSAAGAVVNVTEGTVLEAESAFIPDHRYIVAEESAGTFPVVSDTAVAWLTGDYRIVRGQETDYYALADAMKAMGLLKGTDTPYGSGYDLEKIPTRIEGLAFFLRLLGEEETAMQSTGSGTAFADVPEWGLPYVSYAYDKGYTKGVETDGQGRVWFGSDASITADEYVTFLLRALKYREGVDFGDWTSAVSDAVALNVLTEGEKSFLTDCSFLRAQTIYLSYYALFAPVNGEGRALLDCLIASGAVDGHTAATAVGAVTGQRR